MNRFLSDIKNVLIREIRFIRTDVNVIVMILLAPILYPFIFGTVYINKSETDVPIVVVDWDNTSLSRELIRELDSHQLIDVNAVTGNYNEGVDEIKSMSVQGMIIIPSNYEADLKAYKGATLKVYLNTTRFLVSNDINKAVNEIAIAKAIRIRTEYYQRMGYGGGQAEEMAEPLNAEIRSMFNTTESYGDFLLPGILVLILQQTLLFGIAESVAKEREENSMSGLFAKANRNLISTVLGKGIFYFILFAAYTFLFYTMHFYLFGLNFSGSASALVFATIIFLMSIIFIGIFISSFFKKKILSLQVLTFTSYPVFLISGYSWPIESMPLFMQWIAQLIPSTPYFDLFIKITQMGAGWSETVPQMIHLAILAIIGLIFCLVRLNFLLKGEEYSFHTIQEKAHYKTT